MQIAMASRREMEFNSGADPSEQTAYVRTQEPVTTLQGCRRAAPVSVTDIFTPIVPSGPTKLTRWTPWAYCYYFPSAIRQRRSLSFIYPQILCQAVLYMSGSFLIPICLYSWCKCGVLKATRASETYRIGCHFWWILQGTKSGSTRRPQRLNGPPMSDSSSQPIRHRAGYVYTTTD